LPEFKAVEVPETIEGWYVLHDVYQVDWTAVRALSEADRNEAGAQAAAWLTSASAERGDSAAYSVLGHKGDLMFVHYRETPDALASMELALRKSPFFSLLKPTYSYLSTVEVSLYEVQAMAARRLTDKGLERGTPAFDEAMEVEFEKQKERMNPRLWSDVPGHRYICFYPMNKRRGEHVNWYAMPLAERRAIMRGHGSIGHKYSQVVKQVIGGSVGLDDWEWGVSLHSDDMLVFKKLIYEMRFDPASSWFAEFGPFYLGIHLEPQAMTDVLDGRLPTAGGAN
jgi:peroxiredoxin